MLGTPVAKIIPQYTTNILNKGKKLLFKRMQFPKTYSVERWI